MPQKMFRFKNNGLRWHLARLRRKTHSCTKKLANECEVYVGMGYRGHGHYGEGTIHVDKRWRGNIAKSLWKKMKRRAVVEPTIGHCKNEHRMERNYLRDELAARSTRYYRQCR